MRKMPNFFARVDDIPLRYKFFLIYILCILIPIVSVNIIFLNRISKNVTEKEEENFKISMDRARGDIAGIVDECVTIGRAISIDRTLVETLDINFSSDAEFYDYYDSILRDNLNRYMSAYTHVARIGLYTSNSSVRTGGNYYYMDEEVRDSEWYKAYEAAKANVLLFTYKEPDPIKPGNLVQRLSVIKRVTEYGGLTGFKKLLKIDINMERLYAIVNRESSYLKLYLVDDRNRVVCAADRIPAENLTAGFTAFNLVPQRKNSIVFDRSLGSNSYMDGWRLVGTADRSAINSALAESRYYILFLTLASTFAASVLIFIILWSYNYRIRKLSRHMEEVKNQHFELIPLNEGKDEIGGLIRSFNLMTSKIKSLINDVYKLEIQKRDLELERMRAELNFLQSQMNPHFLFNTLNAILVVCVKNSYSEVVEVIKYLSKTLRRLLSWKDDLVPLQEEISFTEMYLKIEKFRFGDKINYDFHIDESTLNFRIPKMSVQPLVENACKHGLQAIKGTGCIRVEAGLSEDKFILAVEDNGCGIESERLSDILQDISGENDSSGSIGIRNVYRRLKLYYGDRVKFEIDSRINEGTRVYFAIPVKDIDSRDFRR